MYCYTIVDRNGLPASTYYFVNKEMLEAITGVKYTPGLQDVTINGLKTTALLHTVEVSIDK